MATPQPDGRFTDPWWETYDARPRFGTNWTGLRGQMAILSWSVQQRSVPGAVADPFVQEVLTLAAAERSSIKRLVAESAAFEARFGGGPVDPGTAH